MTFNRPLATQNYESILLNQHNYPPSAIEVELAVGPDPSPGPWCQVGCAVCVEGGWRVAAAAGGSGHVGSDHGGGKGACPQAMIDLFTGIFLFSLF